MKIAIDASPLQSGHKVRGVGFYLSNLLEALDTYYPEHEYIRFNYAKQNISHADVIHYPYFEPFFLTLPLRFNKPTVITIHDLTPLMLPRLFPPGKKGLLKWEIQKRLAKKASAIITDSENSKKDIHEVLGIPNETIFAVHLAPSFQFKKQRVEEKDKKHLQEKFKLPEKFVMYVGDVSPNKNLPHFLKAMAGTDIPVVLVGKALTDKPSSLSNPWEEDKRVAQEMIRDSRQFHAVGFVSTEELNLLYNIATCLVLPSLYEGFGLSAVEAMACGCPVVCSDIPVFHEVSADAAMYFDPNSNDSIAETVKEVYSQTTLQKDLQEKGLQRVKKYSWKKTAEETIRTYSYVYNR